MYSVAFPVSKNDSTCLKNQGLNQRPLKRKENLSHLDPIKQHLSEVYENHFITDNNDRMIIKSDSNEKPKLSNELFSKNTLPAFVILMQ